MLFRSPIKFPSVNAAIMRYYSKIVKYSGENEKLLMQLIESMKKIDNDFAASSETLLQYLIKINNVIDPLVNIFGDIVGNKSIFEFINCSK